MFYNCNPTKINQILGILLGNHFEITTVKSSLPSDFNAMKTLNYEQNIRLIM